MSAAVRTAAMPRALPQGLVDRLGSVQRAAEEAVRLSPVRNPAEASPLPMSSREVRRAFRLVDSVTRQMDTIRQALVKASNTEAPQNKVQSTFEALLTSGELLESSQFRARVGWTRQALSKAVLGHRLFFLEVGAVRAFPALYLDLRYNRKDVEAVTKLLGDLSGGSKWLFFTTQKASLARSGAEPRAGQASAARQGRPRTPLQAIEDGDVELVKLAAAGYAER